MNKLFLLCFIFFLIPFATAEIQSLDTAKTGSCINLPQSYANSTFQLISHIQNPDKTLVIINDYMSSVSNGFYNYSFCNTSQNGKYIVNGIGDVDGVNQTWQYDFSVNPIGKTLTSSQALLYILVFVVAVIFFLLSVSMGIYLPSYNNSDAMTGYVLAVSNMKYIKMFFICISYLMFMLMCYFGWMISYGYLDMDFLGTLFNFAFYLMVYLLVPFVIVGLYVVIANLVHDAKLSEMLGRGLKVRE